MATKLYVGNLAYDVSNEDLRKVFAEKGEVASANVATDRDTGRSRGFGFVEMESDQAATTAIRDLNGVDFHGRKMVVNEAKPREERGPRRGGGRGGPGGGFRPSKRF